MKNNAAMEDHWSNNSRFKEALKLAREHIDGNFTVSAGVALAAIDKALAQPEQEPVAVVETIGGYPDESAHVAKWLVPYKSLKAGDKLYTTPPQRTWVGLTDDERRICMQSPFITDNYKAIEAKLKEKNT